jgi:hypothetical protein
MCPECLATTATIVGSVTSAGGVAVVAVTAFARKVRRGRVLTTAVPAKQGDDHDAAENRVER